ncbi:MAG: YgaP family membrane protein [Thiobacillus sp.]
MAKNVGGIDRLVRAGAGVALIAYAMSNLPGAETWMVPAGIVGFILVLTAIFGWCPAYLPFGIKTNKSK